MRRAVSLSLLLLVVASCRRTPPPPAAEAGAPPLVPEVVQASREGRRVIFVGLDGADWQLLDGFMASGVMPNLARLVREGRSGALRTLHPPLSPLVWTTMMTGVSPLQHGILDFTRFDPATRAREPIPASERRVPAVWNMASWGGRSVAVFGLWATWPAEPVRGLLVADRFLSFTAAGEPPPGVVHPPEREAWAREVLARTERETGLAALRSYLPDLTEAELREARARSDPYGHPVSALVRILVETRTYDALARAAVAERRPDLAVVYFQGTDTLGHVFAPYAPPRQPSVPAADYERFHRVPSLYFAEVDRLLGAWRDLAESSGAVLVVASDHGFLWGEGRPTELASAAAATAGRWHRDEGIYLLRGEGIEPGARARGRVDQVCATLLSLLGLPAGEGLTGPPLPGTPAVQGRSVDYRRFFRAPPAPAGGSADAEAVERLRALGYVGKGEPLRAPDGAGSTRTAGSFNNEGLLLREAGRTAEAAAAFERALGLDPANASTLWNLSDLIFAEGKDRDRADDLLVRAVASGLPEGPERVIGRAIAYDRAGETSRSLALLDAAAAARPGDAGLLLFRGRYRLERQQCRDALADFERSAELDAANALTHASAGLARLCLGDPAGAARDLRRSLEIDPNQPEIRRALGELGG
jgi:tetratricopeptide (TPR) repeat protein